jgi:radical SAM protein with 4Fe4S-binding SPASM domain
VEASIITTYRCQNRCRMCSTWKFPTRPDEEFKPALLHKLPRLSFCNITGGEPFLRDDIAEIVRILRDKSRRIVISTNGLLTDRILAVAAENPGIGVRVSLEGLAAANDELRGTPGGFDRGLRTLRELKRMGVKDIGFGITVSDRNAKDMLELYRLAKDLGFEFATAVVHNSFYFHKYDNAIRDRGTAAAGFETLCDDLLATGRVKNWFRAYFNYGLINYIHRRPRLLPCGAGQDIFFLDPWGEILPCNGLEESVWFASLGNLNERSFKEIWSSAQARRVREQVASCPKNCWMIGTAGPAMKKHILKPAAWVAREKLRRRRTAG